MGSTSQTVAQHLAQHNIQCMVYVSCLLSDSASALYFAHAPLYPSGTTRNEACYLYQFFLLSIG